MEDSFLAQPNYKWYMNEPLRQTKLAQAEKINNVRLQWWKNFTIGLLISGPLLIYPFSRRYYRMQSGVPYFHRPKFVLTEKSEYNQARNWTALKKEIPLWLLASWFYAYYFTDFSSLDDEYLVGNKIKKYF